MHVVWGAVISNTRNWYQKCPQFRRHPSSTSPSTTTQRSSDPVVAKPSGIDSFDIYWKWVSSWYQNCLLLFSTSFFCALFYIVLFRKRVRLAFIDYHADINPTKLCQRLYPTYSSVQPSFAYGHEVFHEVERKLLLRGCLSISFASRPKAADCQEIALLC